ncbi:hypothetical protein [Rhizobium tubonense]|uniref:Growth inhibitor PemK n=1 Tax=Rhizobium tubonense TaxID=484088 RepID=A0A2W4CYI9_9HYPH|nr:hypothetical protein [Rhizobium tubonense]PZM16481.1 hypothetical protein CPY51_03960 [Rhizobium tubonense]
MLEPGQVVRFFYLWSRQPAAGEESGRKARPVCVVVRTAVVPGAVFLFPISSQMPGPDRPPLAISQVECRRAGLDFPCWIILDEYNRVELDKAYDLETTVPLGSFSPAFLKAIANTVKQAAASRKLGGIVRS